MLIDIAKTVDVISPFIEIQPPSDCISLVNSQHLASNITAQAYSFVAQERRSKEDVAYTGFKSRYRVKLSVLANNMSSSS